MTAVATAHPTMGRNIVKAAVGVLALAAVSGGLYEGAGMVARHYQQPSTHAVSYASQQDVNRTLRGAWHKPATAGDFRAGASISTPDVVSVVVVLP